MLKKLDNQESDLPLTLAMIALLLERKESRYVPVYMDTTPQHILKVESIMIHLPPEYTEEQVVKSIEAIVIHPESNLVPRGYKVFRMDIRLVLEEVIREVATSIGMGGFLFPDPDHPALPERSRWDLLEIGDASHGEEETDPEPATIPV